MRNKMENPGVIKENWASFKEDVRRKFHELTDDDLEKTQGDMNHLEGLMTDRTGSTREEARKHLENFMQPYQNAGASQGLSSRKDMKAPPAPDSASEELGGAWQGGTSVVRNNDQIGGAPDGMEFGSEPGDTSLEASRSNMGVQSGKTEPQPGAASGKQRPESKPGQGRSEPSRNEESHPQVSPKTPDRHSSNY